ncbi:MAG: cysteine desulfurase [Acidobacteria bacterium]|nr:cysteine desulfurase [Acidobacteriota bacterium]
MQRIYVDNNATTPVHPDVLRVAADSLGTVFGNASSIHKEGQTARRAIEEARESVARLLGAAGRDVIFTSGGTESNNAAIFGAMGGGGGQHVVTTAVEHPSVLEAVSRFPFTAIRPARDGRVSAEEMIAAIRPETRLVTIMLANNETGVIQPVAEVARVCRERGIHVHCDAVQAAGKIDIDVEQLGVDTLSVSAHKLNAPKGIGALYVRRGLSLAAHVVGGAQERRRRAGTENVPLAAAFGAAAKLPRADVAPLRDQFEAGLPPGAIVNGAEAPRIPNTSNVMFPNADAEGIVIGLDLNGIAASTGSACSSGRIEPSGVLLAMGLTPDEAKSTVRFSFGRFNTSAEVERVLDVLREIVPRCRRT